MEKQMKRVTGIGGIFFKAQNPTSLKEWYREHLGIDAGEFGATFTWRDSENPEKEGQTAWSPFPHDTKYFEPSTASFMINYRVADLDGLLAAMRTAGLSVDDRIESYDYGRFAWITDPEGNRIELWEPTAVSPDNPAETQ
jgi:predicted enzyme related to lactoylglutathione lyase